MKLTIRPEMQGFMDLITSKGETMPDLTEQELQSRFSYHAPTPDVEPKYVKIRETCKELAREILIQCPDSRERSVALTKLDEVMFWSNASIARNS